MKPTDYIWAGVELSKELGKNLVAENIITFADLARLSRQELREKVPKLRVRHLANLEHGLEQRKLKFVEDGSIKLDEFINQAKLCALWEQGVFTYEELDMLTYEAFVRALGGPKSRFFRNKTAARAWMEKHKLSAKKQHELPHLSRETAELLYKAGLTSLRAVAKKTDFELSKILQGNMRSAGPLTRARLTEIKYALWKEGIDRACKPL